MKERCKTRRPKCRGEKGNFLLFPVFLLFVFHFSLLTAYAEEIGARAAVVIDGATEKILYAKNPNWKLPPASTTKLVTAMVVLDRVNPESVLTISETAAGTPSVSPRLRAGERFTVREVLHLALMRSVNSAAVALAEAVAGSEEAFTSLMNEKAASIGAENT
ncbi:MAG: D-alanyl-D-alanine carboxypeptidase, partial [Nitrospirae bacterium]|nr:D-alanyl-D-alanine carboxypeptidase [Nitrospirota bacterium]